MADKTVSEMIAELDAMIEEQSGVNPDGAVCYAYKAGWLISFVAGMANACPDAKQYLQDRLAKLN
jgi:hypothetical protein